MTEAPVSLVLVRRIRASPGRVYEALTRPDQMLLWWGPDAGPTLEVQADVRPGGRFSIVFRTQDGQTHNPTGVYLEVDPDRTLVFTWEWPGALERDSQVSFRLRPIAEGVELTLTHARLPDAAARRSHDRGWNGLLDKLLNFAEDAG